MTIIKARNIAKAILEGNGKTLTRAELFEAFQKLDNAGMHITASVIWKFYDRQTA